MASEVTLRPAEPGDADSLARLSRRAFESDHALGGPGSGGPPGYDDPAWQRRMMRAGDYWCVLAAGALVGGAIVFDAGEDGRELARVFVDPERLGEGIGGEAVRLVMARYPGTPRWMLDTPSWNPRTRAFYEGLGFTRYGSITLDGGLELDLYEKRADGLF